MDDRIRRVLAAVLGVRAEEITADASPTTVSGWDSLKHIKLVLALEEEFAVQFEDDELHRLLSVDAIREALAAKCT